MSLPIKVLACVALASFETTLIFLAKFDNSLEIPAVGNFFLLAFYVLAKELKNSTPSNSGFFSQSDIEQGLTDPLKENKVSSSPRNS